VIDTPTEVVVVGSGPGGANAAAALVEAGRRVTLLDVGNEDRHYEALIPPQSFIEIRRGDPAQHRYFLGDEFEGIPFGPVGTAAQLTPPRAYLTRSTRELLPIISDDFSPLQSLAVGGLAAAWGGVVGPFSAEDFEGLPFSFEEIRPHYAAVVRRIGVSGPTGDDLAPFYGPLDGMMPPAEIDGNAEAVLRRYARHRRRLNAAGFHLGRARLAMCTEDRPGRHAVQYRDMEFWADTDRSVYRPRWTLESLGGRSNFTYLPRRLVLSFEEPADGGVIVRMRHLDTGAVEQLGARALVLAAGTLGTARIVLRSLARYGARVPLLCNPYTYAPSINVPTLGAPLPDRRHSLCQLAGVLEADRDGGGLTHVQLYSYRSLLTFRLLPQSPLAFPEGLRVMQLLLPSLAILVIHHEDRPTGEKYCLLHRAAAGEEDPLEIRYTPSDEDRRRQDQNERRLLRHFRALGCWTVRRIRPGHAASLRYAGTFPATAEGRELTSDAHCRLRGTRHVYLADGSIFHRLPAKGLTFTLMACANRVGAHVAKVLA
jgi:choline dehydrogenase-like flavoprotein